VDDRITLALREIDFCNELEVTIANGKIVKIHKGRYFVLKRAGVKKEIIIDEDICL